MFSFIDLLFGCAHRHCTFPRTAKKPGTALSTTVSTAVASTTYVVCLDCGKQLPYDWQQMRVVAPSAHPPQVNR